MKFFHLSDLHLGKRVNEFSMLDDQQYILTEIIRMAREEKPDAVLISGDVYDKSIPPVEAVQLLDRFLVRLHELDIAVFIIAGNHDSVERVAFGSALMQKSNVHISQVYSGQISPIKWTDPFGEVNIWMLPYLKPAHVRRFFPEHTIDSYSDALAAALGGLCVDTTQRNILLAHQFVTGAITSESEEISVGGLENVDAALFSAFDYVALGHIHRPQHIGRETLRYCGTPLKYSFSEIGHSKSVTIVEIGGKGTVRITETSLHPQRDMREIRGSYAEITNRENYIMTNTNDYIRIILTDEEEEPDAVMKLRTIYPNLMRLEYDNKRTQSNLCVPNSVSLEKKAPIDLLEELYALQNGQPMRSAQKEYAHSLLEEIWEAGI